MTNSPALTDMITLISQADLAQFWGYKSVTNAFRHSCRTLRIEPVPGRRGWYDPALVRRRMDEAQGMATVPTVATTEREMTPREQRRARRETL